MVGPIYLAGRAIARIPCVCGLDGVEFAGARQLWQGLRPMLEPGSKFDKYTIVRRLGAGGMGMVYEATNPFGVSVVLKMLHPELLGQADVVERFRREGRIQYTLRHPNIVRVTDIVEQDGLPALVVDFMKGRDLEEQLMLKGPLSAEDAIKISTLVLDALQLAHSHGFFHRDLKPSNIFLEESGSTFEPRLMDFGIAKIQEAAALTQAQEFCGTPAYASPEQIASTKDVDHMTDIYSFGVVMWSMCTGVEPYRDLGDDPYAVLAMVVREKLPPLPDDVPSWLKSVIEKATQKNPDDRFQTALEFRDAIVASAASSDSFADTVVDFSQMLGANTVLGEEETYDQVHAETAVPPEEEETLAMMPGDRPATRQMDSGATVAQELHDAAFGEFSDRAKQGLEHQRREAERRAAAERTGTDPDRARSKLSGSPPREPYRSDQAMDAEGRVVGRAPSTPRPQRPRPAPGQPRDEDQATTRELERAREVEASFRGASKKGIGARIVGVGIALGVLAAGAFGAMTYFQSQPQAAPSGFVRIEPTTFAMGSPVSEAGRGLDEDLHDVRITRPFAIQTAEVTQAAWRRLMYSEPDSFEDCGEDCPITNVSWLDAVRFANRYSIDKGVDPCYVVEAGTVSWPEGLDCSGYRLPTEAEWELAARSGSDGAFFNGALMNTGSDEWIRVPRVPQSCRRVLKLD